MTTESRMIDRSRLVRHPQLQFRPGLIGPHIEHLTDVIEDGSDVGELQVVEGPEGQLWLCNGYHRDAAYEAAGVVTVPCQVTRGDWKDAIWMAITANRGGLPLNQEGKRRAAFAAFSNFPDLAADGPAETLEQREREVAEGVHLGMKTVRNLRKEFLAAQAQARAQTQSAGETVAAAPAVNVEQLSKRKQRSDKGRSRKKKGDAPAAPAAGGAEINYLPESPPVRRQPEPQEEVFDMAGRKVPPNLRDVFADTALPDLAERFSEWARSIPQTATEPLMRRVAAYPFIHADRVTELVAEARQNLIDAARIISDNLPHVICHACDGIGGTCMVCRNDTMARGCGYLTAWRSEEQQRRAV